ncbi:MAG: hypothetical protein JO108_23285 [Acidobacteriaceae bacterium]|nr:hypothetical protein [Acidobacteriaceae bacterium]
MGSEAAIYGRRQKLHIVERVGTVKSRCRPRNSSSSPREAGLQLGPRLEPIEDPPDLGRLATQIDLDRLASVFETISRVKPALPESCGMLGFCGAPWTVASYMIAGRGTPDLAGCRS